MILNTEAVLHPKLQHVGLLTGDLQRLLDWYTPVLGMRLVSASSNPTAAAVDAPAAAIKAAFLSNDEVSHRLAVIEVPGLTEDPERSRHQRVQHLAFELGSLDDLLGTYLRLKRIGIVPVFSVDEGPQTAFYYEDPDRNSVEINVNNYTDRWAALDHMQTSAAFARKPLGIDIDPDKLVAARQAGATPWELHLRAWQEEFLPQAAFDVSKVI
jgi:catechol 2,3-dioxygenase-like lactoylglutathione lyase family enzyme